MAILTRQPTANVSPDPVQGGLTVTSPINTGHALTTSLDPVPASPLTRTCKWTGFAAGGVAISQIRLKFDWAYQNAISDAGGDGNTNSFNVAFSMNGGGAFSSALNQTNVNGSNSGSVNMILPIQQDLTIIQVRDLVRATAGATLAGRIDASISNITLEITTIEPSILVMM